MRAGRREALALAGSAVLLAAAPARAQGQRAVLEDLLSLERSLESMYEAAARRGALPGTLAERLRDHEREHAKGLEQVLTGRRAPVATVPSPALNRALAAGGDAFAAYALRAEEEAVRAYANAVTGLKDPELLQPLGSIMAAEGQHLVALRAELGARPLTKPFEIGRVVG
ncbi:MAG: ferritin-like domain-containing protein [Thermoleophilaceae bacterium]|nr:ferritin-like domain-containing protein [Thermoleophilaceae bacterium]